MPETATAVDLAGLARDIAIEYLGLPAILRAHEIDDAQWEEISRNPEFQQMAAEMRRSWQSASNARERVKMKAGTAVEAMLPVVLEDIVQPTTPLIQKIEALKLLAKLGELGETRNEAGERGERFSVVINLGAGAPPVTIDGKLIEGKAVEE